MASNPYQFSSAFPKDFQIVDGLGQLMPAWQYFFQALWAKMGSGTTNIMNTYTIIESPAGPVISGPGPSGGTAIMGEAPDDGRYYGRVSATWGLVLPISGGTMTGPMTLAADPTAAMQAATKEYVDKAVAVHGARVWAASSTLNNAVANNAFLQFDTTGFDSDGYAPLATPFSAITIPAGLAGTYIVVARSSGSGNQATTLGMGIVVNGSLAFSETNQSISGPASVNYVLDNDATQILLLNAGDTIQLKNNSVSTGTNVFTSVSLVVARL